VSQYNVATSADGTRIAYQTRGLGEGLVVVPGNSRVARDYDQLADHLASSFTVHVMERRGRGASGPQGDAYVMTKETEDLQGVLTRTGARLVFGHSYGGLVALECARSSTAIDALAVFEPAVSLEGSIDVSWLPRFKRAYHQGRHATALAVFLLGLGLAPRRLPAPLLTLVLWMLIHSGTEGRQMRELMHTTPPEVAQIAALDSDGTGYATVLARTLLLGGTKSPGYLTRVLPVLEQIVPRATSELLPGLGHNAPDLDAPQRIAERLVEFFGAP
jgi:pimeloyl-ACP methyl ester carboxylesterase